MECINISVFGDTIYVANGTYKEQIITIRGLALIGTGADSTIIDTRDLATSTGYYSVRVKDSCIFKNFRIIVSYYYPSTDDWWGIGIWIGDNELPDYDVFVENNLIENAATGILSSTSNSLIKFNIINNNSGRGIELGAVRNIFPKVINNLVITTGICIGVSFGSTPYIANNICLGAVAFVGSYSGLNQIYNNLAIISSGGGGFSLSELTYLFNNVVTGSPGGGISPTNGSLIKNNIIENADIGIFQNYFVNPVVRYNNIWNTDVIYNNILPPDSTNLSVDPMFVNDTSDFHLQMYSRLIDAGDPTILDIDGSRSDIGIWGGPYGERYTYRDLAPKPPANLTAQYDSGLVLLTWDKNTETDFYRYRVYRDTVPDFMYDTTKIIAVTADTFFYDDIDKYTGRNFYYKLTAIDSAWHQSAASEEVKVIVTGAPEAPPIIAEEYKLLNNYPNPFNPSTKIPYRLVKPGYVKLYVYDIKGEVVRVLVNGYQSAGYYEVEFKPNQTERERNKLPLDGFATGYNDDVASGIYIYQIMVKGEGDIPVFSDMKKMILLK